MALEAASGPAAPASSSASSFGPGQELPPLENTEEKEDQTFEEYVGNLFLNNKFSGLETLTLMQKAKDAGTPGLESWSRLGGGGKHPQNAHRDLLRALLKKKDGPNLYWANIPLWDQDSSTSKLESSTFVPLGAREERREEAVCSTPRACFLLPVASCKGHLSET